ncbi:collagen-binding domain-containing protein [Arthrobacter sp. SA17]
MAGSAAAASATSGSPTCVNPLAQTHNFTVIVEDNAALGSTGAGGEIEGSLAAGGDVRFGLYNLLDNSDGSALPTIGSPATQLLVGGTIDYSSGQKLDLNAGFGKITDTSGLSVTADGRLVQYDANRYVKSQYGGGQSSVNDYTAAAETYSEAFPADYFDRLRTLSAQYAALTEGITPHWFPPPVAARSTSPSNKEKRMCGMLALPILLPLPRQTSMEPLPALIRDW